MTVTVPADLSTLKAEMSAPCEAAVSVTPSDSSDLPNGRCRALYVGSSGNVTIVDFYGNTTTFVGASSGSVIPVRASRVKATNTTAASIVALY